MVSPAVDGTNACVENLFQISLLLPRENNFFADYAIQNKAIAWNIGECILL